MAKTKGKRLFQLRKSLKVRQTMTLCHAEDHILYIFRYVSAFAGQDFLEAEQHIFLKNFLILTKDLISFFQVLR